MKRADHTLLCSVVALLALLVIGPFLPKWLFLLTLSLGKGLVVLGLMLLLRTGTGLLRTGLYYCLGAYAVGSLAQFFGLRDVLLLLLTGVGGRQRWRRSCSAFCWPSTAAFSLPC